MIYQIHNTYLLNKKRRSAMTLQQLHYAITIAESGSLNKAAEILYVAQPSLSGSMQELEKELGITVFNRSGRGVTLTADAVEFLQYAKQLYGMYEMLAEKYGNPQNLKKKFGVSTQHYSFAVKAFVALVKAFDTSRYKFAIRETKTKDDGEEGKVLILGGDATNTHPSKTLMSTFRVLVLDKNGEIYATDYDCWYPLSLDELPLGTSGFPKPPMGAEDKY